MKRMMMGMDGHNYELTDIKAFPQGDLSGWPRCGTLVRDVDSDEEGFVYFAVGVADSFELFYIMMSDSTDYNRETMATMISVDMEDTEELARFIELCPSMEMCKEEAETLCRLAGLSDEWKSSEVKEQALVRRAADRLHVPMEKPRITGISGTTENEEK